ncbi:MAG: hypothetical protein ACLPN1_10505 [Dissulfurispiraceae bacterium]
MQNTNNDKIKREFRARRIRQIVAIATTFALLLLLAILHDHTHILDSFSKNDILATQVLLVCAFIGFSSYNWRCPSCNSYIGPDINRRLCRHCGARLQ